MQTPSRQFRTSALLTAGAAAVLVFILWNVSQLNFLTYPFRLFVTFVHESGHGLAALATGGRWEGFVVNADGSGLATTGGGNMAVILPAGYLGAAFFGALLFYLTHTLRYTRALSITLGVLMIGLSLVYTDLLSTAFLVGVGGGGALLAIGWKGGRTLNLLVLNLLALLTALHAVLDLVFLIGNTDAAIGTVRNDAAAFSAAVAPLIPPVVWAIIWAGLAILMVGAAFYYSIIHPLTRKHESS